MRILVTGATGTVGRVVVDRLLEAGHRVRALTRNPATSGLPGGAEVVAGDLTVPSSLDGVLDGVERAYLLAGARLRRLLPTTAPPPLEGLGHELLPRSALAQVTRSTLDHTTRQGTTNQAGTPSPPSHRSA
ncbi:SDR family oxidoreductase [Nonomuraea africana]|uniref:SDR family oxidoreductase n=1 Tax=Nonomuraea africana TaxID=46171 RepID=UPI0033C4905E